MKEIVFQRSPMAVKLAVAMGAEVTVISRTTSKEKAKVILASIDEASMQVAAGDLAHRFVIDMASLG